MKAKEIMTGDYFRIAQTGKIIKILAVDDNSGCVDYFDGYAGGALTIGIEKIEPIPLTEKMLEKNGFTHRNADKILTKQSWTCECGGCTIHAKYNFGFLYFNIYGKPLKPNMFAPHATMHIQHVHELQHALRLCGLSELADNFKV